MILLSGALLNAVVALAVALAGLLLAFGTGALLAAAA